MSDIKQTSDGVQVLCCGPQTEKCKCACPNGPCEHKFDGPTIKCDIMGATGYSSTCSRCGLTAVSHDIWVGP